VKSVFKYFSTHGIDVLTHFELRVTPPNQFNDPLEFSPRFVSPKTFGEDILKSEGLLRQLHVLHYKDFSDFEDFKRYAAANLDQMAAKLNQAARQATSGMVETHHILERASQIYAVMCLSERRDSLLMWGHYADRHRGIVIGFDRFSDVFAPLRSVDYVQDRVEFNPDWALNSPQELGDFTQRIIFSKNEEWKYEAEMRRYFYLHKLPRPRPLSNGEIGYFVPILPESILSVSLGVRCSAQTERDVLLALKNPQLAHVTLEKALLHDTEFRMAFTSFMGC
jgi:hypothetical protein